MNNKMKLVLAISVCGMFIAVSLSGVAKPPGGNQPDPSVIPNDDDWNTWDSEGNMFAIPQGNVGIGTSNPEEKLHVSDGNIRVDNGSYELLHSNGFETRIDSLLGTDTSILNNAGGPINFWTGNIPGVTGTQVCITNTGNVGIGTQNPSDAKLQVEANDETAIYASTTTGSVAIHGVTNTPGLAAVYGENNFGGIAVRGESTDGGIAGYFLSQGGFGNTAVYGASLDDGVGIYGTSIGGWAGCFLGNVTISGNVGINSITPISKLDVEADDDIAIIGATTSGTAGVYGLAGVNGAAVHGQNPSGGIAISGYSDGGYAGYFVGDVNVNGDLEVTGTIKGETITPTNVKKIYFDFGDDATYNVEDTDTTLFVNAIDTEIHLNLPPASEHEGRIVVIKKIDDSNNYIQIYPNSGDHIEIEASISLGIHTPYNAVTLQSDGDGYWYIIGQYLP